MKPMFNSLRQLYMAGWWKSDRHSAEDAKRLWDAVRAEFDLPSFEEKEATIGPCRHETRVCFLATPGSHGDPAKIEADAHLIAAAPDLFAALKRALDASDDGWLDDARAAIAKATGAPPMPSAE